jgi:hypothetical protein
MIAEPSREPSHTARSSPTCLVCGVSLSTPQQRYCTRACQQQAYRLRHRPPARVDMAVLRSELKQRHQLTEQTVYECPSCQTRLLGDQRCTECNTFAHVVGLGGTCPECDAVVLLADLLGEEVLTLR